MSVDPDAGPVAVVGAGIVGISAAAALAEAGAEVLLLEAQPRVAEGATTRNSQVLHGGFLSQPRSLRQRLAVAGSRLTRSIIVERGLPWNPCGKLLLAIAADEVPRLEAIASEAEQLGVPVEWITAERARSLEPALGADPATAAWFPDSAVIDTHALLDVWLELIEAAGGAVLTGLGVDHLSRGADEPVIHTSDGETTPVAAVVNAAGMDADRLLAASGVDLAATGWTQEAWVGQWFRVRPPADAGMDRLVYRTSRPGEAGLSVHTTPDSDSVGCRLGPDSLRLDPLPDTLTHRHRFDDDERHRADFLDRLQVLYPHLERDHLLADQRGVRSRLPHLEGQLGREAPWRGIAGTDASDLDGFLRQDESAATWQFPWERGDDDPTARVADALLAPGEFVGLPGTLHLLGMESPMLSGAAALAQLVARWWRAA